MILESENEKKNAMDPSRKFRFTGNQKRQIEILSTPGGRKKDESCSYKRCKTHQLNKASSVQTAVLANVQQQNLKQDTGENKLESESKANSFFCWNL